MAGLDYDVFIVGAGFGGIMALHHAQKKLGLRAHLIDSNSGPGGTWWANRYPGAMSDTDSWLYRYSWDLDLLKEFPWKDHYSKQHEVLGYLEHVCDRFDLRKDMTFNCNLLEATWDEENNLWVVTTSQKATLRTRYLVTALGLLSAINWPDIPGRDKFKGQLVHTAQWPSTLNLEGKRVAVIGCGSTGVQVITSIAPKVKELYSFQRHPQYNVPANDRPVSEELHAKIDNNWPAVWDKVRNSAFGFGFDEATEGVFSVPEDERQRRFEKVWQEGGGFRFMFGAFNDIIINKDSNEAAAQFIRDKIKNIVKDPKKARVLTPNGYYATRPICDAGYYQRFNQDNVHVIHCGETPIQEVTEKGLRTADGKEFEVDVIVFATGFTLVDGNYNKVRIQGTGKQTIRDKWYHSPSSFLGTLASGFPNLFMIMGPSGPMASVPPIIEAQIEFLVDLLSEAKGRTFEATEEAEDAWLDTCGTLADALLFKHTTSWFYRDYPKDSKKYPGKKVPLFYMGGLANYRAKQKEVRENGFEGVKISPPV